MGACIKFWARTILGQVNCLPEKIQYLKKIMGWKINFGSKKIVCPKKFGVKKTVGSKNFVVQMILGPNKIKSQLSILSEWIWVKTNLYPILQLTEIL